MKYYLIYENTITEEVAYIDAFGSQEELYSNIDAFNYRTGFRSFYKRVIEFDTYSMIDFGSHTRFYYFVTDREEGYKLMKELETKYEPLKQVILVNGWLNMPLGKTAAQASHASIAFMTNRIRQYYKDINNIDNYVHEDGVAGTTSFLEMPDGTKDWILGSFTKIILEVRTEEEWESIKNKLDKNGVEYYEIVDKGLTLFNNVPTHTCTGFIPMKQRDIDKYFGSLPLLK